MQIWNYLNASLIFSGGYDKNKDSYCFMCSQLLDGLKMIYFFLLKVMLPCHKYHLHVALPIQSLIYIWMQKLSVQDLFLGELFQVMVSLARD
jgi:hypothetical protein